MPEEVQASLNNKKVQNCKKSFFKACLCPFSYRPKEHRDWLPCTLKKVKKSCLCELPVRPRRLLLQLLLLLLLLQLCLCLRLAKVARTGFEATLKNNCPKDSFPPVTYFLIKNCPTSFVVFPLGNLTFGTGTKFIYCVYSGHFFFQKKKSTSFLPHLQPVFGKSLSFLYIFCCVVGPNAIEARRRKLTASLILNMNNEYRTIQALMKIYP